MSAICKRVHYTGQVQGVGFRMTAQRLASGFAVTGYVRNLANGDVEVLVAGEQDAIDRFLRAVASRMEPYIKGHKISDEPPQSFTSGRSLKANGEASWRYLSFAGWRARGFPVQMPCRSGSDCRPRRVGRKRARKLETANCMSSTRKMDSSRTSRPRGDIAQWFPAIPSHLLCL